MAEGSRQLSATVLSDDIAQGGLLLTYQDPSGQVAIMHGFSDTVNGITWSWRNQTDMFNSMLSRKRAGYSITDACSSSWDTEGSSDLFYLYCFANKSPGSASSSDGSLMVQFQVAVDSTTPYNVTIDSGSYPPIPTKYYGKLTICSCHRRRS